MKKKPKTVYKTLRNKIWISTLTLWLVGIFLLTWAVGADFYNQLKGKTELWVRYSSGYQNDSALDWVKRLDYNYMLLEADPLFPFVLPQYGERSNNELSYGYQSAIAFYDQDGNILFSSGDYLCFSGYYPVAGSYKDSEQQYVSTYIDLNTLPGGKALADKYFGNSPNRSLRPFSGKTLSIRGYFEGEQFYPVEIKTVSSDPTNEEMVYTASRPENKTLVTITTTDTFAYHYEPGSGFFLNGKYHNNPLSLFEKNNQNCEFGLFGAVIRDMTYTHHDDSPDAVCQAKLVIYCNPMAYAVLRMWPVYLFTFALVFIIDIRILRRIRREVTDPMMVIVRSYEQNRSELSVFGRSPLTELKLLGEHFDYAQQERHKAENEVQQLRTALTYAENAEENRKKMVSAIAHELKTPLAVIHSYAEGLQEGIAPEKQEKYLSVILSESQKMDELVQQMLDLSRLEAGKITLSTDQVDLAALTRDVFEKLSLAAEARQLQVELDLTELSVVADEARINQVITNFATNAVKYATEGGNIRVQLTREGKYVLFAIENDAPHFSAEALEQVWQTFYRGDTARDRSGTGLGLAIAKNIIELHRGSCKVRNTKTGVEFSFRIPM